MVTYNSITLPNVRSETNGKNANLFSTPLPKTDSSGTIVLDLFGVTRTINITGDVTGDTSTLQTFINNFEGLVNGDQTKKTFVSSIHGTNKSCVINSFRYTYSAGNPRILNYELEFIESVI